MPLEDDGSVRPAAVAATPRCPGCGLAGAAEGPTDPYGGASPACWATFQAVTVRDYGEFQYPAVHGLIVDSYMAQHPGYATASGRRSVAVHLVGLCLALERDLTEGVKRRVMAGVFPDKPDLAPLAPVPPLGALTIASLVDAPDLEAHSARARAWAEAVWRAWSPFHPRVRAWADAAAARAFDGR
jgi:hypothetical protein